MANPMPLDAKPPKRFIKASQSKMAAIIINITDIVYIKF